MNDRNYEALKSAVNKYVKYWDQEQVFGSSSMHCIHSDDIETLAPNSSLDLNVCFTQSQIDQYVKKADSKKIHVDLMPSPYMGDIENARVIIFMNNPGIGKQDRYTKTGEVEKSFLGEYTDHKRKDVLQALTSTIKQDMQSTLLKDYKFAFLHPELHNTEGGKYTLRKLRASIEFYCKENYVSKEIGIQHYANNICILQNFPYHCGFEPKKYQSNLKSHSRMQEFYQEIVPILCRMEDRLVVIVRGSKLLREFASGSNVIDYMQLEKAACLRAHFSVKADGKVGIAIAEHIIKHAL